MGGSGVRRFGTLRGRYAGYYRRSGYYGRYTGPRPELKFHDVDADLSAADRSNGVIVNTSSINLIAQGVTESQRVGRKCTIRSIAWRGQLKLTNPAGSGGPISQTTRLMVVLDKQCNGAAPNVDDILETTDWQSFNNLANKNRFRTLYDKTFVLNPLSASGDGTANDFGEYDRAFTFFKKCSIPIEFDSTTGAITEIKSNNLVILAISDTSNTVTTMNSKIRLRFSDM